MNWINPLLGGLVIGLAATWMLLSTGRVTGISGILSAAFFSKENSFKNSVWRILFLLGLLCGGLFLKWQSPEVFFNTTDRSLCVTAIAGVLVGFGTKLANGCTSGHGICGLARFSFRSLIATVTFMFFGALTVFLYSRFA